MLLGTCLLTATMVAPDAAALGEADVRQAIDALGQSIVEAHHTRRHWDPPRMPSGESVRQHTGGYTALAALALITAGHDAQVSPLREALDYLESVEPDGTYAVAFRAQVWAALPDRYLGALRRDIDRLVESFHHEQGGWDYLCQPVDRIPRVSPSTRHVAMLALHAAAGRGIDVPPSMLARIDQATMASQHDSGGWSYYEDTPATGSMTAAGVFTLVLVQDLLQAPSRVSRQRQQAIDAGLQWLDERFEASPCPGGGRCAKFPMYWLYALERMALATGCRTLRERDWLRDAVAHAMETLCTWDGGAGWSTRRHTGHAALRKRCFALMLLHRSMIPLSCAILDTGEHQGIVMARALQATLHLEHETNTSWQRVRMCDSVDAWLEAPMLVVSSRQAPAFLRGQKRALAAWSRDSTRPRPDFPEAAQLREYFDQGGLAVVPAASGSATRLFRQWIEVASPGANWVRAEKSDPILSILKQPRGVRRVDLRIRAGRTLAVCMSGRADDVLVNAWAIATEQSPFPPRLEWSSTNPITTLNQAAPTIAFIAEEGDDIEPGAAACMQDWAARSGRPLHVHHATPERLTVDCDLVVVQGRAASRALQWAREGHLVLVAGGEEFPPATPIGLNAQAAPAWMSGAGLAGGIDITRPEWRPSSRMRGLGLPLADITCARASDGGMVLHVPSDLAQALIGRPHWGLHGWEAAPARGLLWNLAIWSSQQRRMLPKRDEEVTMPA